MVGYLNIYSDNDGTLTVSENGVMDTEEQAVKEAAFYVTVGWIYRYTIHLLVTTCIKQSLGQKIQDEYMKSHYDPPPVGNNNPWDGSGEADSEKALDYITDMTGGKDE
jgi:hypothetical protein